MVDFCVWTGWLRQVGGWKGRANDSIGEGMLLIGEAMQSGGDYCWVMALKF